MRAPKLALTALALAALWAAFPPAQSALAAKSSAALDCQQLLELYRACHGLGLQADSVRTCQEASQDFVSRAETKTGGKNPQATRALVEVVCATGCEDALSGQPPATVKEFTEAFCDTAPATKTQGGRQ